MYYLQNILYGDDDNGEQLYLNEINLAREQEAQGLQYIGIGAKK
jgi:hypothetical protein